MIVDFENLSTYNPIAVSHATSFQTITCYLHVSDDNKLYKTLKINKSTRQTMRLRCEQEDVSRSYGTRVLMGDTLAVQ